MGSDQSVPHVMTHDVSKSMEVRKVFSINARVNLQPTRFAVNLKCDNGDIAFHFNPRFNQTPQVVVCNTQTGGKWGHEEQNYQMPFRPGEPFLLTITIRNTHYKVSVNGKNYLRYDHRLPFHSVKELEILGDVKFEDNGKPPIEIYEDEKGTPDLPKCHDPDNTPRPENPDEQDEQSAGCCFCKLFVKPQWIKCTKWKIGGGAVVEMHECH